MKLTKSKLKQIIKEELKEGFMDKLGKTLTKPLSFSKKPSPTTEEQANVIVDDTFNKLEDSLLDPPRDLKGKVNMLSQMKDTLSRALIWGPEGKPELALTKLIVLDVREEREEYKGERMIENFQGHDPLMISYIDNIKQAVLDGQQENIIDPELSERLLDLVATIYERYRGYEEDNQY